MEEKVTDLGVFLFCQGTYVTNFKFSGIKIEVLNFCNLIKYFLKIFRKFSHIRLWVETQFSCPIIYFMDIQSDWPLHYLLTF